MLSWTISSSSGRERFELFVGQALALGKKAVVSIRLSRDFWKREVAGSAELVKDVRLELSQVLVEVDELKHLLSNFEAWLDKRTHFEQSIGLHDAGDQVLRLSVGRSPAFIYTAEKPTFTIFSSFGGYFSSESSFIVDESCVRLAHDSLADLLAGIEA